MYRPRRETVATTITFRQTVVDSSPNLVRFSYRNLFTSACALRRLVKRDGGGGGTSAEATTTNYCSTVLYIGRLTVRDSRDAPPTSKVLPGGFEGRVHKGGVSHELGEATSRVHNFSGS